MSTTSKSPRKVALAALQVGRSFLPDYAHRFSPRTYTQPQLFACLVLKAFFRTDYRGIEAYLRDWPDLVHALGLRRIPDHSTLHKTAARLFGKTLSDRALDATLKMMMRRPRAERLAIDASGFETRHISRYFIRRRERSDKYALNSSTKWQTTTYRRFPKLALAVDCKTHLILATHPCRGPTPDIRHIERVAFDAWKKADVGTVLADAGYDAEWVHELLRDDMGLRSLIPPKIGRPTTKPPTGYWRAWMAAHLHHTCYGQRWQVETVFSMIKRRLGDAVNATTYWAQCRALNLLAVTHNIMILLPVQRAFRRSRTGTFVEEKLSPLSPSPESE